MKGQLEAEKSGHLSPPDWLQEDSFEDKNHPAGFRFGIKRQRFWVEDKVHYTDGPEDIADMGTSNEESTGVGGSGHMGTIPTDTLTHILENETVFGDKFEAAGEWADSGDGPRVAEFVHRAEPQASTVGDISSVQALMVGRIVAGEDSYKNTTEGIKM